MKNLFIGGGTMAAALIGGLIKSGQHPTDSRVVDPDGIQRMRLATQFPNVQCYPNLTESLFDQVETVVLAVKPQQLQVVARQLAPFVHRVPMVLSIAAGIRVKDLSRWLGDYPYVIRAMPNTPALVGAGITAVYATPEANETARAYAHELLSSVGNVFWLIREEMIDAMTALSGSGPAYVFYFLESLQIAAQNLGLTDKEARFVALETLAGGLKLAQQSSDKTFSQLRAEVTSKGGTTEHALNVLNTAGAKGIFLDAIQAAWQRAVAMGDELAVDVQNTAPHNTSGKTNC